MNRLVFMGSLYMGGDVDNNIFESRVLVKLTSKKLSIN